MGFVLSRLINDLASQLTWVMVIGFMGGAILCARKNLSLFIFLFLIAAPNAAFFVGWREESYFPSYIVACLWAGLFFYWLLCMLDIRRASVSGDPGKADYHGRGKK